MLLRWIPHLTHSTHPSGEGGEAGFPAGPCTWRGVVHAVPRLQQPGCQRLGTDAEDKQNVASQCSPPAPGLPCLLPCRRHALADIVLAKLAQLGAQHKLGAAGLPAAGAAAAEL